MPFCSKCGTEVGSEDHFCVRCGGRLPTQAPAATERVNDWLARNIAGVSSYGHVMGCNSVTNGLAVGRYIYVGHGTRDISSSDRLVFQDMDQMLEEGCDLYCPDPVNFPPWEDSSELSKHSRAAGIGFACALAMNAAFQYFVDGANKSSFNRSIGAGVKQELTKLRSGILFDLVHHYVSLPHTGISLIVNLDEPGKDDLLAAFLEEVRRQTHNDYLSFRRSGELGFDSTIISLAEETMLKVRAAGERFGW